MQTAVLDDLLCADDIGKNASKERKMPEAIDRVSQACDNYDLKINTKWQCTNQYLESPAMKQQSYLMNKDYKFLINSPILEALVNTFTCLRNTLSRAVHTDDDNCQDC